MVSKGWVDAVEKEFFVLEMNSFKLSDSFKLKAFLRYLTKFTFAGVGGGGGGGGHNVIGLSANCFLLFSERNLRCYCRVARMQTTISKITL